ncbi:putative peroxin-22-like protein [Golovinomyces cichoracearum]|uniref:Putative peroxin-22-like protein n=1 Tax=Golovinomyces cichoracearum TaxID=62708 RepID=A0A420IZ19_9PEZI|nr:putative peroxin-22-like protein [Golovinomyces cichoracearum]
MSYSRHDRNVRVSRKDTLSYWLPLALTVSAAAIGVATWIWSEREDDDNDDLPPKYQRKDSFSESSEGHLIIDKLESPDHHQNENTTSQPSPLYNQSYMARMSSVLRRTPSPQQIFDGASRSIVDGITAAGAVVGTALGSIMEEDKNAYKDHQTWSEEADSRAQNLTLVRPSTQLPVISKIDLGIPTPQTTRNRFNCRKTVAIVLSADNYSSLTEVNGENREHTSILSYLPQTTDFSKIRLFILIHAPLLKVHPFDAIKAHPELRDFPSNIQRELNQVDSPSKQIYSLTPTSTEFDSIYFAALNLVEKDSMVLPFTSTTGHAQILRHLNPDIIYLQESLSGTDGEIINHIHTWSRQDVVLIIDDSGAFRGSAEYETKNNWWRRLDRVGRGRGVIVVDAVRVGDDWAKRVENKE